MKSKSIGFMITTVFLCLFAYFFLTACCETETMICATVDGSVCETSGDVYVCPGEPVYLYWHSSKDVQSATISPDVGSVTPTATAPKVVYPKETVDYTITVKGQCERTSKVHVMVIKEGTQIDMMVPPIPKKELWEKKIPSSLCTKHLVVTSITPMCGLNCFIHKPPIINYPYLDCGQNAMCNCIWHGTKIDLDGHIRTFDTKNARLDIADYPFVGIWQFQAQPPLNFDGYGYFQLTAKCR